MHGRTSEEKLGRHLQKGETINSPTSHLSVEMVLIKFDMTRAGTDRVKSNRCHVRTSLHRSGTRFHDARSGHRGDWPTETLAPVPVI